MQTKQIVMKKIILLVMFLLALLINIKAQDRTRPLTLYYNHWQVIVNEKVVNSYNVNSILYLWGKDTNDVKLCVNGCEYFQYFIPFAALIPDNSTNQILFAFFATDKKEELDVFFIQQKSLLIILQDKTKWLFY